MKTMVLLVLFFAGVVLGGEPAVPIPYQNFKKALFIGAHPDDIEGCAGGLISNLVAQGSIVDYVIVTNGDKGCGNPFCQNWTAEHIAFVRHQEAISAAAVLKIDPSHVTLLDYEDAMVTSYPEQQIRFDLVQQIRRISPTVVFSWFPYPKFELQASKGWDDLGYHPDHQAVGKIVLDSVFDAGLSRLFPNAGYPAHGTPYFYMWEFLRPAFYFPLDDSSMLAKINSYLAHQTQYSNPNSISYEIKQIAHMTAQNALVSVEYIEGFISFH